MKSKVLILFIIFNLLAINLVSASQIYNEHMTKSPIAQTVGDSKFGSCIDESVCSHFCHISAHMVGMVSQKIHIPAINLSPSYLSFNEPFHLLTVSPPVHPPKA